MKSIRRLAVLGLVVAVAPPALAAEGAFSYRGWGPRMGLTLEPDQFHAGVHMDLGYISDHVRVHPNIEVGVGDDLTIVALNLAEAAYRFSSEWNVWTPYLGGAMSIYIVDRDRRFGNDGSDTEVGLSAIGGIEKGLSGGSRFFVQTRLGLIDSPDLSLTIGWTFY